MTTKIELDFFSDFGRLTSSRTIELSPGPRCFINRRGIPEVVEIENESGRLITSYDVIVDVKDEKTSYALVCIRNPNGVNPHPYAFLRKADGSINHPHRECVFKHDLQEFKLKSGDELMIHGGLIYEARIKQE